MAVVSEETLAQHFVGGANPAAESSVSMRRILITSHLHVLNWPQTEPTGIFSQYMYIHLDF